MRIKNLFQNLRMLKKLLFSIELKRGLYVFISCILLVVNSKTNAQSKNRIEIKGELSNSNGERVYLELMSPEGAVGIDTVLLNVKGGFVLTFDSKDPGFYRLKISDKNFATLIIDANQKVSITGDVNNLNQTYLVEGSTDSKLFLEIDRASSRHYQKSDSLQKMFQALVNSNNKNPNLSLNVDSIGQALESKYNALLIKHNNYLKETIEKNTSSLASLVAIQQLPVEEYLETYIKTDASLFARYPNSSYIKSFHLDVLSKKQMKLGSIAPDIKMNTPDGEVLSLSSQKGKVILVDFWASWCGPCRGENPNVVKAYHKYKMKGFDVFNVSLDTDPAKWKQAIIKDNLVWSNHICDFKGWQSSVVALYGFKGIPYNVLLDKEGKIIAKNLRGEDLEKKLSEIFN